MYILDVFQLTPIEGDIGLEIELEGHLPRLNSLSYWYQKSDHSLRGFNREYILRKPSKIDEVNKKVHHLDRILKKYNAILQPSERCSTHVHINCQKLEEKQVLNFVILYYILEPLLLEFCGKSRKGNVFCLSPSEAEYIIDKLIDVKTEGTFLNSPLTPYGMRYGSINFSSLTIFGSLEFRALDTTPDFLNRTLIWVHTLWKIKEYSLKIDNMESILEKFSGTDLHKFVHDILGEHTRYFIRHNMKSLLYEGIRNMQDVIYTEWGKDEKFLL